MLETLLEPKFCLAFSLKKDVIIKSLWKPFLRKKDESQELKWTLHKENTNLFFITKLWALQVHIRHESVFHHPSLSNALLRSLRKPLFMYCLVSSSGWGPKHRSLISFCQQLTDWFLPQALWKQGTNSSLCCLCLRAAWFSPKIRYGSFLVLSLHNPSKI